jgi:hypothetical protein
MLGWIAGVMSAVGFLLFILIGNDNINLALAMFTLTPVGLIFISWRDTFRPIPCKTFIDKNDGKLVEVYYEGYDGMYVPYYRYEKVGEGPISIRACKRG